MDYKTGSVSTEEAGFRLETDSSLQLMFPSHLPASLDHVERKPRADLSNRKLPPSLSMIERSLRESASKAPIQEELQEALVDAPKVESTDTGGKAAAGAKSEAWMKKESEFFKGKCRGIFCWKAHPK